MGLQEALQTLSLFARSLKAIFKNIGTFLFGYGLGADGLIKDPHNLYLELAYYIGVTGLVLYAAFCIIMFRKMQRQLPRNTRQNVIAKYLLVLMMLVLYFPLNGMFITVLYSELFLTLMAVMMVKKEPAGQSEE